MAWWRRKQPEGTGAGTVARSVRLERGDAVMASSTDTLTGRTVVASKHEVIAVGVDGREVLRRPWSEVDAGGWENTTGTVSVTWVDGSRATQWTFGTGERRFAEVFRDRVEASRVIDAPVELEGRTVGRAAIRKDLRTGDLLPQLLYSRSVRRDDAAARGAGEAVLAALKEQVGL